MTNEQRVYTLPITKGRFDNGRGLNTRFRLYEQAPNKRATVIGTLAIESGDGSGRGQARS